MLEGGLSQRETRLRVLLAQLHWSAGAKLTTCVWAVHEYVKHDCIWCASGPWNEPTVSRGTRHSLAHL